MIQDRSNYQENREIIIRKTWRSEPKPLLLFLTTTILAVYLSRQFEWSVIRGTLFTFNDHTVILSLPIFILVPFFIFASIFYKIYNVRYKITPEGIDEQLGILGFNMTTTRLRFDDIRSVVVEQGLLGRILDYGDLLAGSVGTAQMEINLKGIGSPAKVKAIILQEQDLAQAAKRMADL
ncbi:MAG TPA: PH domain-containing protein [Oligoflexia bacterium]|nr:PH domain-containing protein [Oligoflexia bacterium]HMP27823.1 PH domain-containing protein [Oligoflexia bacterium]